jgi:hypothetical protein
MRIIERLNFQSTAQTIASWVAFAVLLASAQTAPGSEASEPRETRDIRGPESSFPRLMGMNIGAKNYDDPAYQRQLARLDVVILGFYKGWKPGYGMAKVVRNLKELSGGKILVGQYTILNECGDDPKNSATLDVQTKLNDMDWWARKADGSRVQWTAQYRSWDINFTAGSRPDAIGQRFPQWLAERDDRVFFKPVPFDLWYCDNVFFRPRVTADWNHVGADGDPKSPAVAAAYRAGHRAEWDHIRRIHPGLLLMGNTDGDLSESEYAGQLESAFLEGLMSKSWSIETWGGWSKVMSRYHAAMANTRSPHIVGFNVHGDPTDYRFFRYAYASCLLDDGYFCFTAKDKEYSSVTWFDEFDSKLGAAVTQPPTGPWQSGVWRRDFEHGIALVNPAKEAVTLTLDPGFCRLKEKQDPATNDGSPATSIMLPARDGIILSRQLGQHNSGRQPLSEKEHLSAILPQELIRYAGIEVPSRENIHVLSDGAGRYLEFRLVPGQPKKNNGIRAEISVDYPYSVGDVLRYRWEMRLPEDFKADEPLNRWWVMGAMARSARSDQSRDLAGISGTQPASVLQLWAARWKGLSLVAGRLAKNEERWAPSHYARHLARAGHRYQMVSTG